MIQTKRCFSIALAMTLGLSALSYQGHGQEPAKKDKNKTITPAAAGSVVGSGTPGHISKWSGVSGSSTFVLGDSNIFEDKFGKVGIGTTTPTSLLTVQGMIEITMGGLKFPDGTLQTTAFNPSQVVRSLNGLTGDIQLAAGANITITPTGNTLTVAATNALTDVVHNATLIGNGTAGSPLGVAVPLILSGSVALPGAVIQATNTAEFGTGINVSGGISNHPGTFGGSGVSAVGGSNTNGFIGGVGVRGTGGDSAGGAGGLGVAARGGNSTVSSTTSFGGPGIETLGGKGKGIGKRGGAGIVARGGFPEDGATEGLAGDFRGNVEVTGTISAGVKPFKIDHPLDPENKYLFHVAIESPDMMNIYNGNVTTDENGDSVVTLPDYFEALNKDFRYQLTVIGTFAQAIVAQEIKSNRFLIKTNVPNIKVSWQVTGVRQDAFANKNRIPVEVDKPDVERGYYLHPEAFDQPEEKSIQRSRGPERMRQLKQ